MWRTAHHFTPSDSSPLDASSAIALGRITAITLLTVIAMTPAFASEDNQQSTPSTGDKVVQAGKDVVHKTVEVAKKVGHGTVRVAKKVGHTTTKVAGEVGHGTANAATSVGHAVKDTAHSVGHTVGAAVHGEDKSPGTSSAP